MIIRDVIEFSPREISDSDVPYGGTPQCDSFRSLQVFCDCCEERIESAKDGYWVREENGPGGLLIHRKCFKDLLKVTDKDWARIGLTSFLSALAVSLGEAPCLEWEKGCLGWE